MGEIQVVRRVRVKADLHEVSSLKLELAYGKQAINSCSINE